jgi:hypothetical protein
LICKPASVGKVFELVDATIADGRFSH